MAKTKARLGLCGFSVIFEFTRERWLCKGKLCAPDGEATPRHTFPVVFIEAACREAVALHGSSNIFSASIRSNISPMHQLDTSA